MTRTGNITAVILTFGAVVGVALGLILPAPALHAGHSGHLLTPGAAAE
jgi:hypothetical protein